VTDFSRGRFYAFWSNNGHELFYETTDFRIMVVDYKAEGNLFVHGKPRLWSEPSAPGPAVTTVSVAIFDYLSKRAR
jgi:hypothetical protein